jgi:hypothetical protein
VSIFSRVSQVHRARRRAQAARYAVGRPASKLLARERENPLTTVGAAAGVGFVLGTFNVHPLRVPGLSSLLSGGLAEAVAYGAKLIAEFGVMGMGDAVTEAFTDDGGAEP